MTLEAALEVAGARADGVVRGLLSFSFLQAIKHRVAEMATIVHRAVLFETFMSVYFF